MGVSVKGDGAIGKFGTGLKYAIAGILRLNGRVEITIEGEDFIFTAVDSEIRGKTFRIVHCNSSPCGFTTELGKHWAPWQLFRELASNAKDEGGGWTTGDAKARTAIRVWCREVEDADKSEAVFITDRPALVCSSQGATIYEGPSKHYYFRGIRAGSFNDIAPVTIDVCNGDLSEDRLLDLSRVQTELSWAFKTATTWSKDLLLSIIPQEEAGSFWVENLNKWHLSSAPADIVSFLAQRPKFVNHPAFRKILDDHLKKGGIGKWEECDWPARGNEFVTLGEALCLKAGIDPVPRSKVHFTRDLDDRTLAVTCMDTRDVWFSTKLVMRGRDEFLCGYIEEALHAMTGFGDCTRELQNALFSIVVTMGERLES